MKFPSYPSRYPKSATSIYKMIYFSITFVLLKLFSSFILSRVVDEHRRRKSVADTYLQIGQSGSHPNWWKIDTIHHWIFSFWSLNLIVNIPHLIRIVQFIKTNGHGGNHQNGEYSPPHFTSGVLSILNEKIIIVNQILVSLQGYSLNPVLHIKTIHHHGKGERNSAFIMTRVGWIEKRCVQQEPITFQGENLMSERSVTWTV